MTLTKTYIPKSILDSFKSAAMELTEGGLTLSKSISVMYKLLFKSLHSFANCRWMLLFLFKDFFFKSVGKKCLKIEMPHSTP